MKTQNSSTQTSTNTTPAQAAPQLTRRKMSDSEVLHFRTPYYPMFGPGEPFEAALFTLFNSMCEEYTGGFWTYFMLSSGAWYLAPDDEGPYRLKDHAGHKHEMSKDGAGLLATLYVLNVLSWKYHADGDKVRRDAATEHYHALRMYTYAHPDSAAIWAVLN